MQDFFITNYDSKLVRFPQNFNLLSISRKLIRRFKNKRQMLNLWVVNDVFYTVQAYGAFSDYFMPVFSAVKRNHTVIYVHCFKAIESNDFIKFIQYAVKIVDNIITGRVKMTSIHAHTDFFRNIKPINNSLDFFKR